MVVINRNPESSRNERQKKTKKYKKSFDVTSRTEERPVGGEEPKPIEDIKLRRSSRKRKSNQRMILNYDDEEDDLKQRSHK